MKKPTKQEEEERARREEYAAKKRIEALRYMGMTNFFGTMGVEQNTTQGLTYLALAEQEEKKLRGK